jgi:FixJ family two-component response regulator
MTAAPGSFHLAIVDDDVSHCCAVARLLRASGMKLTTFHSAEAFLDRERPERFDCLILDVQLGGMSGIELCARLTQSGIRTPVVFLTAHDEHEQRERAERAVCAAFLGKTEPGERLLAVIKGVVTARSSHTTGS